MTSPAGGGQYQQDVGAPGGPHGPKITSVFDFSAEALEQIAFWLEQRGLHIPVNQLIGFNNNAVRNYKKSTGTATVSNTVTETDVLSEQIPGGTLGTTGGIRVTLTGQYTNNTGATPNLTIKIKLGGSTLYTFTSNYTPVAAAHDVYIEFLIGNQGTGNQFVGGLLLIGATAASPGSTTPLTGSSTVDTTAAQTLEVTVQHASASASLSFVRQYYAVELI